MAQAEQDAAETLANKIEEATVHHGAKIKLTLIAHSMGGLISRYYLESRLFEKRRGFSQIKRLITLGTPHRGAPLALTAALGMEKRLFLNKEQVKELAAQIEFPSLYQLLPPEDEHFVWDDREAEAELAPFSVDRNWKDLGLNRDSLQAARDFSAKLKVLPDPSSDIRYFFFSGTRMSTLCHVRIASGINTPLQVTRVELKDAGDGTVPSWSSGLPGVQGQFVGGEHGSIYKESALLRTLATLLGKKGVLAAVAPSVQIAVREMVVEPEEMSTLR